MNKSHLDEIPFQLCIDYAGSQQELISLKGNSLHSVSSEEPVVQTRPRKKEQEIGKFKLRVHSLVYHSKKSRPRLPM